ncbi:tabersonine 16-hydroxylase 2-like [Coffea arabica]|uniref:Tabersonine 16-hydroxylase 2-like n=1 Tax=Coffea arabica TaxID=13443 RepID=A0A6P6S9Z1_COFAR|nr:tabersonine 16-hydroxylase 2-like [Coffea arabica]
MSARCVQMFRSIREYEVLNMIKSISAQEGSVINLTAKLSSLTFSIINRLLLIDEVVENILNEHRVKRAESTPGYGEAKQDLVDVLLNIQQSGEFGVPLTDNNIKAVIFEMYFAGVETSSTTMAWAMAEMIKNPRLLKNPKMKYDKFMVKWAMLMSRDLHELKYLQAVIKEAMRLHPAASLLLPRECSEQCEIQGYEIPVKTRVFVNAWAIGRDPDYWTEPEKFIPERFLDSEIDFKGTTFNYIAFGAGRRMCLAYHLLFLTSSYFLLNCSTTSIGSSLVT